MLTFIIGGISRSTASFVLYPINLIRTRQMKQRFSVSEAENFKRKRGIHVEGVEDKEVYYVSFRDSARKFWINEGVKRFSKVALQIFFEFFLTVVFSFLCMKAHLEFYIKEKTNYVSFILNEFK